MSLPGKTVSLISERLCRNTVSIPLSYFNFSRIKWFDCDEGTILLTRPAFVNISMAIKEDNLKVLEGASTFTFGDSESLCNRLLDLVRQGRKTATCGALRDFESGADDFPVVGRRDIALNWDGTPALIIETISVNKTRYCDVEASFALAEGENESLEGWRQDHQKYFERNGGFDPEMMLVCEHFKLVKNLN